MLRSQRLALTAKILIGTASISVWRSSYHTEHDIGEVERAPQLAGVVIALMSYCGTYEAIYSASPLR
jgi:hypothetical protein